MNKFFIVLLFVIIHPTINSISQEEKRELKFERDYMEVKAEDIELRQSFFGLMGGISFCYTTLKLMGNKKGSWQGIPLGLSATAVSIASYSYLESETQKNREEYNHIVRKLKQLTDK